MIDRKVPRGKMRVIPVPGRYIPGVPDIPQDLDPEEAARLLAYSPPAFTAEEPVPEPVPEPSKELP